jgi:hypothetical protein
MSDDDTQSLAAREHLRAHREGVLIADGLAERIRFVIDCASGRLIFPTTPAVAEAGELVLFIPEEDPQHEPELQLLLSVLALLDPDVEESCDRWRAYHGEPRFTRWVACAVESARFAGEVVESEPLNERNALREAEPALCRMLNVDRARLGALCQTRAGIAPREPLAVGVDDTGIDVRARFGIIRIHFPHPCCERTHAEETIRSMLEDCQT